MTDEERSKAFMPETSDWINTYKYHRYYHCRSCGVVTTEGQALNMGKEARCQACSSIDVYCVNPELKEGK